MPRLYRRICLILCYDVIYQTIYKTIELVGAVTMYSTDNSTGGLGYPRVSGSALRQDTPLGFYSPIVDKISKDGCLRRVYKSV